MSSAIAASIPPQATCHVIDYSSQHEDVVACLPEEGLIILRKGRVVGWCDVGNDVVSHISIFFTYQPYCKHYVLQLATGVKVVSHSSPLKVAHTFENVVRFEIRDFTNSGFPQLGLWEENSISPRITDLTASSSLPSTNPVEAVLSSKLKGLQMSVEKACKQLEEKTRLRRHCMFHILGAEQCDNPHEDMLIPVIESPLSQVKISKKLHQTKIVINNSWQRLLGGKWILGCDVQNNSSQPLRSLSLAVVDSALGDDALPSAGGGVADGVQWRVLVPERAGGHWSSWTRLAADGVLEAGQRAVVVAFVSEPSFTGRGGAVEVRGLVSAALADGRETWTAVPPWRLTVADVLTGRLAPFRAALAAPHEDLLASLTCSPVAVGLRLQGPAGLGDRVIALLAEANVRPPTGGGTGAPGSDRLLVGAGPADAPLHGALALLRVAASDDCTLRLHVRDARLVYLVIHCLLDGLPRHTRVSAPEDHDEDVGALSRVLAKALDAELRSVVADEGASAGTLRAELHPLEMATDLAAQRLRVAEARAK